MKMEGGNRGKSRSQTPTETQREAPHRASVEWVLPRQLTCTPSGGGCHLSPIEPSLSQPAPPCTPSLPKAMGGSLPSRPPPPTGPPPPPQAHLLRHPLPQPRSFHPPAPPHARLGSSLHAHRQGEQPSAGGTAAWGRSPHPTSRGKQTHWSINGPWLRPRQTRAPAHSQGIHGAPRPWPEGTRQARAR